MPRLPLSIFCCLAPKEVLGLINLKRRGVFRSLRGKSLSPGPLLSTAWCSAPSSTFPPLSIPPRKPQLSHSLCGQPSTQPAPAESRGDALTWGRAEPLSLGEIYWHSKSWDLLWGALENLTPSMNDGKQLVATKFFNESPWGFGGVRNTKGTCWRQKKRMWNPGDKWRFPLLCNKIGLLKFNRSFQNISNSPATITAAENNWEED